MEAIKIGGIKDWFPEHDQEGAMKALMELIGNNSPVVYAEPAISVWLDDIVDAIDWLDDLEEDYVHWFL